MKGLKRRGAASSPGSEGVSPARGLKSLWDTTQGAHTRAGAAPGLRGLCQERRGLPQGGNGRFHRLRKVPAGSGRFPLGPAAPQARRWHLRGTPLRKGRRCLSHKEPLFLHPPSRLFYRLLPRPSGGAALPGAAETQPLLKRSCLYVSRRKKERLSYGFTAELLRKSCFSVRKAHAFSA